MLRDLKDAWGWIEKLLKRVERLESAAFLEDSSITEGRMRFIGGTLRIDSGGTAEIDGTLAGVGDFTWSGPWVFEGEGDITGNVGVSGNLELSGAITVPGTYPIKIHHKSGLARIDLGPNGTVWSAGDGVVIFHGDGSTSSITVSSAGIDLAGDLKLSQPGNLPSGVTGKYLIYGSDGHVYVGSVGGGGGDPGDPPAGNPEGYIWPADPAVYGISDDFADHVARGSAEPGVDVRTPVGTPIWSPANGTIIAVKTETSGATGRYITLVTEAGDWFRFLHCDEVAVTAGQTVTQTQFLGRTGGSGFGSEAYYGPHLHLSFSVGYTGTFPGASAMDDFEAYMAAA